MTDIRVLVVGLGNMGLSHARAYKAIEGFEIAGLCSRNIAEREDLAEEFPGVPQFNDYAQALTTLKPDAVSINTWPDTHAAYARMALEAGAHVFIEKPLAETVAEAEDIAALAEAKGLKLVIGYILRVHPSWVKFVEVGRTLGKPLVMRMNLNQQSSGAQWQVHRHLMNSISPIVDCGVHYVDVMCQVTGAKPVSVHAVGARLTSEIDSRMYNYGHLHVTYDDGSVGWYEAGWGPMISQTAYFVKDVFGPKGSVSIVAKEAGGEGKSDSVESHTKTESLRVHWADIDAQNEFTRPDEWVNLTDEPDHQGLCDREQAYFLQAIQEDLDLLLQQL